MRKGRLKTEAFPKQKFSDNLFATKAILAGTEHRNLCIGGEADQGMNTDAAGLLEHGLQLVAQAWEQAHEDGWEWIDMDSYVIHQISNAHTNAIIEAVGIKRDRIPLTFPVWGNVAAAALPMTLAECAPTYKKGDRILCMGMGSSKIGRASCRERV